MAPPRAIEEIFRGALPELVSVMLCGGLVTPCVKEAKVKLDGMKVIADAGVIPVPVRAADWGLPGALSVTVSVA